MSTFDAFSVEKSHRRAFLHKRWLHVGAADEARTRYLHLGKVALYQMSYGRTLIMHKHYRGPRKNLRSKGLWGKGESLAFITAVLLARLPDEPQDFRHASDRNRTNDTGIFSPLLYRLSYRGIGAISACAEMAATRIGLEPTTPSVTGWCSNQLSYRATWWKLTGSNR